MEVRSMPFAGVYTEYRHEDLADSADAANFATQIEEFMNKDETVLSFPANLSSYQRRIIHEVI